MSQYAWENILVKYFVTVKGLDAECEGIRQDLCSNLSFTPWQLFNALDNDSKQFLSLNDFKSFLSSKHVQYEEESLRRLIHNFDKDNDFSIDYNEYLNIVLPRNNFPLKCDTEQRKAKDEQLKDLDVKTEISFIKLLQMELDLVRQLAQIADELKTSKDFTTYEAFLAIAHDSKYITEANLEVFLKDNGVKLELNDVSTLLFRIDSDADGKISYEEFQEIFFPYKIYNASFCRKRTDKQQENKPISQPERIIDKDSSIDMRDSALNSKRNQSSQYQYKPIVYKSLEKEEPRYDNNVIMGSTNMSSLKTSDNFNNKKDFGSQSRGIKSSPRRQSPLMNMELDYRARLNTYTCEEKDNETDLYQRKDLLSSSPQQRQPFNSIRFDKSPMRNSIRTEAKLSPQANEEKEAYYQPTCYCHLTSCCSCCCNENLKIFNLFNLLNDLVTQDGEIERIKEQLAFCSDANLTDLFSYFDLSHRNTIGPIDLTEGLKILGLSASLSDSKMLYRIFDKNLDGRFDFGEFSDMILPKKYEVAKLINDCLPSTYFIGFNYQTKRIIVNLFAALIEAELSHERYRCILSTTPNSSVFESFNRLKKSYCSGIYKEDLILFMKENGSTLKSFESELLMDRLDKNQDGIISYNEFIFEISPQS